MAKALVTLTANQYPADVNNTQHLTTLRGTAAIQASPAFYTAGGLALSWSGVTNGQKSVVPKVQGIYVTPIQVTFFSAGSSYYGSSGTYVGGFPYLWNKALNTLQIMAAAAVTAGTGPVMQELADATAIPAQVSNDVILFEAVFVRSFS
jgi:hypothetical protein